MSIIKNAFSKIEKAFFILYYLLNFFITIAPNDVTDKTAKVTATLIEDGLEIVANKKNIFFMLLSSLHLN